jgi:hypothetical protein
LPFKAQAFTFDAAEADPTAKARQQTVNNLEITCI